MGPELLDRGFALDTYQVLVVKAQDLHSRLIESNSLTLESSHIERLLEALGAQLDDVRPGTLLSRARALEADFAVLDKYRNREVPTEVAVMMYDTMKSVRDLLAAFPILRQIEDIKLAFDVTSKSDAGPVVSFQVQKVIDEMLDVVAPPEPAVKAPLRKFLNSTKTEFVKGLRLYFLPFTVLLRNLPIEIRKLLGTTLPE